MTTTRCCFFGKKKSNAITAEIHSVSNLPHQQIAVKLLVDNIDKFKLQYSQPKIIYCDSKISAWHHHHGYLIFLYTDKHHVKRFKLDGNILKTEINPCEQHFTFTPNIASAEDDNSSSADNNLPLTEVEVKDTDKFLCDYNIDKNCIKTTNLFTPNDSYIIRLAISKTLAELIRHHWLNDDDNNIESVVVADFSTVNRPKPC